MKNYEKKYLDMLEFVKEKLKDSRNKNERKKSISYSRYEHTLRVLGWTERIYENHENKDSLDYDSLLVATIFHDCGYNTCEDLKAHAKESSIIAREYLENINYEENKIDFICDLIARHSNKDQLNEDISPELIALMEADLFDDTGAFGVILATRIESVKPECTFEGIRESIESFLEPKNTYNPMRTEYSKAMWEQNVETIRAFYEALKRDMNI